MKREKLIIKPRFVTWYEAKQIAHKQNGRLITTKEMMRWQDKEYIDVDIWLGKQNPYAEENGEYFDSRRKQIRYKQKNEACLLAYVVPKLA